MAYGSYSFGKESDFLSSLGILSISIISESTFGRSLLVRFIDGTEENTEISEKDWITFNDSWLENEGTESLLKMFSKKSKRLIRKNKLERLYG